MIMGDYWLAMGLPVDKHEKFFLIIVHSNHTPRTVIVE